MFDETIRPNLYVKPNLNNAVEEWLKIKGNIITILKPGFTNFPDGNIPKERVQVKPLDIEKYNADKVTKKAPVKAKKPKLEKSATKPKVVKEKVKKSRILTPEEIAEKNRQAENRSRALVANDLGTNDFIGVCNIHGESRFYLFGNKNTISKLGYKCRKCQNASRALYRKNKLLKLAEGGNS
ncbi:hypothetical protein APC42_17405 [Acinetobacter pittii]|uniref:hypothetical protein n=1 Tax=Acinetobacter pittii TaxID=48296 RepID=UPI00070C3AAB|nr:hypothetical protein [Acinetobacter pittii]KRI46502.1 hypothetical protein APC42_17405 [Acinetobacter pittii]